MKHENRMMLIVWGLILLGAFVFWYTVIYFLSMIF